MKNWKYGIKLYRNKYIAFEMGYIFVKYGDKITSGILYMILIE